MGKRDSIARYEFSRDKQVKYLSSTVPEKTKTGIRLGKCIRK